MTGNLMPTKVISVTGELVGCGRKSHFLMVVTKKRIGGFRGTSHRGIECICVIEWSCNQPRIGIFWDRWPPISQLSIQLCTFHCMGELIGYRHRALQPTSALLHNNPFFVSQIVQQYRDCKQLAISGLETHKPWPFIPSSYDHLICK